MREGGEERRGEGGGGQEEEREELVNEWREGEKKGRLRRREREGGRE